MGCDGGTIPKRNELVKPKQKQEIKDKAAELSFRWTYCNLSQQPLQPPIVMCSYGRLYNKAAILEAFLNGIRTTTELKSLKDVKDLNLTRNPETSDESAAYVCPVTGLEMNGNHRFVALWSCGCVFSERTLKMIQSDMCQNCLKSYREEDVVILNAVSEEDLKLMRERMEVRRNRKKGKGKDRC